MSTEEFFDFSNRLVSEIPVPEKVNARYDQPREAVGVVEEAELVEAVLVVADVVRRHVVDLAHQDRQRDDPQDQDQVCGEICQPDFFDHPVAVEPRVPERGADCGPKMAISFGTLEDSRFFCSTSFPLASSRWLPLPLSSLCPLF